jgi:DNA-binding NarL/FixJ family response regulator
MLFHGESFARPVKLLLVEDNDGDARLFREMLDTNEFQLEHRKTLSDALEAMGSIQPDIVLLDLGLPDSAGLETLRQAAGHQTSAAVIVVLTGNDDNQLAIDSVREGAQDYLIKGELDSELLTRAIRYSLERYNLQLALQVAKQEAEVSRQKDFYTALTDFGDLAGEIPEQNQGILREVFSRYSALATDFIHLTGSGQPLPRQAAREFAVYAAGLRLRARHIVQCHLDVLATLEGEVRPTLLERLSSDLRLLLVEVLGNMTDIYLSVYLVMQPSEHVK